MKRESIAFVWLFLTVLGMALSVTFMLFEVGADASPTTSEAVPYHLHGQGINMALLSSAPAVAVNQTSPESFAPVHTWPGKREETNTAEVTRYPHSDGSTDTEKITLRLEPSPLEVAQGTIFRTRVILSAGSQPIDSVDLRIEFDPSILQVVDAHGNPSSDILPGRALPILVVNRVDNQAGQIVYGAGRRFGEASPEGEFLLGTIRFRAHAQTLSLTGTAITFGDATQVFSGGMSVLQATSPASVISQASWFTGQVDLQGRGVAPNPRWADYGLRVTFLDQRGKTVTTILTTTDESGRFTILRPPSGTYSLMVQGQNSLSTVLERITLPTDSIVNVGLLYEGDVNQDNTISEADLNRLVSAYGSVAGDPHWNARADLNGDDRVGPADLSLILSNFGRQGPNAPSEGKGIGVSTLPKVSLSLEPTRMVVSQGERFEVDIVLHAYSEPIDTVAILLSYDPNHLLMSDELDNAGAHIEPGNTFPLELVNQVCHDTGSIWLHAGIDPEETAITGRQTVARLRFKALANTVNGLQGTALSFDATTKLYHSGQAQPTLRIDGAIVIAIGEKK